MLAKCLRSSTIVFELPLLLIQQAFYIIFYIFSSSQEYLTNERPDMENKDFHIISESNPALTEPCQAVQTDQTRKYHLNPLLKASCACCTFYTLTIIWTP